MTQDQSLIYAGAILLGLVAPAPTILLIYLSIKKCKQTTAVIIAAYFVLACHYTLHALQNQSIQKLEKQIQQIAENNENPQNQKDQ